MAQAMINYVNQKYNNNNMRNTRTIATQTGSDDELFFHLTNKKSARVYYSTVYKEPVLSLNLGNSKSFIVDKASWIAIKNNLQEIDKRFNSS